MRKIAVAARDVIGTGGGTVSLETSRYFVRAGYEVHFVTDTDVAELLPGLKVHVTPFGSALKNWAPSLKFALHVRFWMQVLLFYIFGRRILRRLEREGCISLDHNIEAGGGDVLVLHNVFIAQYRADRRSWLRKLPQFFNPVFGFRLLRERLAFQAVRTRGVIAVSEQTLNEALPYLRPGTRQSVIYNGINLQRFSPASAAERDALRAELGASERFVMLFVGHEFDRKRLDLALGALSLLPSQVCLWVIGGRGSSQASYRSMAEKLGVLQRVSFLGTVSDTERYFRAADVFVLPSDYETWGLVVLEAMACGTPVLMTPVGCAPYVIREGQTGYLIEYTAQSIADKTQGLLTDPRLQITMREAARLEAEGHGWDKVAKSYVDAIRMIEEAPHGK